MVFNLRWEMLTVLFGTLVSVRQVLTCRMSLSSLGAVSIVIIAQAIKIPHENAGKHLTGCLVFTVFVTLWSE